MTIGINSITLDNRHILLMDFDIDNKNYIRLKHDLMYLQHDFNLSDIHIVSSNNGYNAFCLDKFTFIKSHYIISQMVLLDKLFLSLSLEKKVFTLRTGDDKKFMCTIKRDGVHEKSFAHHLFYTDIMNYPIEHRGIYDDNTFLQIPLFKSSKYGIEMELIKYA